MGFERTTAPSATLELREIAALVVITFMKRFNVEYLLKARSQLAGEDGNRRWL
jgi:hypothetical protein